MRRVGIGSVTVAIGLLSSACIYGTRYSYGTVFLEPQVSGSSRVAVATQDSRPYVVSRNKTPQFVGQIRAGFGIPYEVETGDGHPLAENMTTVIAAALARRGFQPQIVPVEPSASVEEVRNTLLRSGSERLLLLTLREWKSDAYLRVGLYYDVSLSVMDGSGKVLGEKTLQGKDNLGGSIDLSAYAKREVPARFKAKMDELFGAPSIASALR